MKFNWKRIKAVILRHLFSWSRSWERLADSFWWPTFDLLIWGLLTMFLQQKEGSYIFYINLFLGGMVMWMFIYRLQEEIGVMFLQEAWDRNLLNLFTSPLTIWEFNLAAFILGMIKLTISVLWMLVLGYLLFKFNIFVYGWSLIPYSLNLLITGWASGLMINGLIIRYGYRVQVLAWTLVIIIQPFSAVFYPVAVMPNWMQTIARWLPSSYVFEGMRGVMKTGLIDQRGLAVACIGNLIYLIFSVWFFNKFFQKAKESGMIGKFS